MKKCVRIGIILIISFSYTFAHSALQITNSSLTEKIVENSTKTPMERANVLLFKAKDGFQVSGITTDKNGIFNFYNLPNGNYYLQIGFIGFETLKTRSFNIKNEKFDLGTLAITVSPIVMGNVEVTAEKETFNNAIDRKVYNVEKDILSQTGSASDLLQNIPSVSVDVDGNVSLRGAANVTIFINGKPSLLMRKNSAVALQQMPANTIERIEVITNPSAKYKPDGVGAIINIVLKKESRSGLNGTVMANAGISGDYFYPDSYRTQNSQTTFRNVTHQITTDFTTDRTRDKYEKEYEINSNYEHNFDKEEFKFKDAIK